jgi:hypothetical protein
MRRALIMRACPLMMAIGLALSLHAGTGAAQSAQSPIDPPIDPPAVADPAFEGPAGSLGRFVVDLPQGGTLWAIEDPTLGEPVLNVQAASMVPFEDGRITQPVRFHGYSNYAAFYDRLEVRVYRGIDADRVRPLATFELPVGAVTQAQWDGVLPDELRPQVGDTLQYVARAYAADGSFDETAAQSIQLVTPADHARGVQVLRDQLQRERTGPVDTPGRNRCRSATPSTAPATCACATSRCTARACASSASRSRPRCRSPSTARSSRSTRSASSSPSSCSRSATTATRSRSPTATRSWPTPRSMSRSPDATSSSPRWPT